MSDGDDPSESAAAWLAGGGEMGERLRRLDWASTPLGATAAWPQSLRSAVSILLPSKAQICLFWGPQLIKLYNDAYIPVLGRKHPSMLGHPGREVWSEIWDVLGPLLEGVVATGEAFRATDHQGQMRTGRRRRAPTRRPRCRWRPPGRRYATCGSWSWTTTVTDSTWSRRS